MDPRRETRRINRSRHRRHQRRHRDPRDHQRLHAGLHIPVELRHVLHHPEHTQSNRESHRQPARRDHRRLAENQRRHLPLRKPAHPQHRDLPDAPEHRQQHRVRHAQPAQEKRANPHRPRREIQNLKTIVALAELPVLQRDHPGMRRLHRLLKGRPLRLVAQLHRHDRRRAFPVKKRLRILQRQKHPAILETVFILKNPAHLERPAPDLDGLAELRLQKLRRARPEENLSFALPEIRPRSRTPLPAHQPRIIRLDPETRHHRIPRRRHDAEQQRMRRLHLRQRADVPHLLRRHRTEKQVRHVFLEHQVMAVRRKNPLKHPDRPRDDRQDCQHRRHAKPDARNADQRPQPMPPQVRENQRKKAHVKKSPFPPQRPHPKFLM